MLDLLFWGYVYDLSSNILFTLTSSHKFEEKCWKWKHVVQHKLICNILLEGVPHTNLAMYHQPTRLECFSVECLECFTTLFGGKYLNSQLNAIHAFLQLSFLELPDLYPPKKKALPLLQNNVHTAHTRQKCFMVYPTQCLLIYRADYTNSSPIVQISQPS